MKVRDLVLQKVLDTFRKHMLNPMIRRYGTVRDLSFTGSALCATVLPKGLEDVEIQVTCECVQIAPDGSRMWLRNFQSSLPCVQNALNRYATGSYAIPEGPARLACIGIKKVFSV